MKKLIFVLLTLICISVIGQSCNATQGVAKSIDIKNEVFYQNLADRLRAEGGINVLGTGENVSIVIRGIQTITGDTRPTFLVDGLNMGRDCNMVNNAIDANNIKRIKVLKGKSETALYGEAGNNGVILITMEK